MNKQEIFIERAKQLYGDKFTYENVEYITQSDPVKINCSNPSHPFLVLAPKQFLRGVSACEECKQRREYTSMEDLNKELSEIFGDRYTAKTGYRTRNEIVELVCNKCNHGFNPVLGNVLRKTNGCPKCSGNLKSNKEEFTRRAKEVHGDKYDYSNVVYVNMRTKVELICHKPGHGPFLINPDKHVSLGRGCRACANNRPLSQLEFIAKSEAATDSKYSYEKAVYVNAFDKVIVTCKLHGDFEVSPNNHISKGRGCPTCSTPKAQLDLFDFVKDLCPDVVQNDRTVIKPLEIDILVDSKKIAIEYDGLYYHSSKFEKSSNYHLDKTNLCNAAGYRLIHVFEDEWLEKPDVVKNRLKAILGFSDTKLYARNLSVRELTTAEYNEFIVANHIQGIGINPTKKYGLFNDSTLVSAMSFTNANRFEKGEEGFSEGTWELVRYCSTGTITGGFSKLLTHFIRENISATDIVSFSDKRWSNGDVYSKNGFVFEDTTPPGFDFIKNGKRVNRQHFQKHKLQQLFPNNFNPELTADQNCENNGWYKIWNCGMDKWRYKISR